MKCHAGICTCFGYLLAEGTVPKLGPLSSVLTNGFSVIRKSVQVKEKVMHVTGTSLLGSVFFNFPSGFTGKK